MIWKQFGANFTVVLTQLASLIFGTAEEQQEQEQQQQQSVVD